MGILDVIRQSQGKRKGIPGRDTRPVAPQSNRPTLIQGGPAYFTPEGYQAPIQPEQAFMPTDRMGDPIGDMFRGRTPPDAGFIPGGSKYRGGRDDYISIGGPGGNDGMGDPRVYKGGSKDFDERGPTFDPGAGPKRPKPIQPPDFGFGPGIRPSEITTADGQFIGSAGVTPPSGGTTQPEFNLGDYKDDIMKMVRSNFTIPSFDDSSLREMIQQNQQQIGNIPQFDPSQLQDQIGGLQDQFGQFDPSQFQFDPSQLQDQIGGLEKRFGNIPSFDPSQLQDQITSIAQRPTFDDSELRDMIAKNRTGITSIPAFDPSTLELPDFNKFATRDDLENRPIYDDTALRDQITSIGQRPGFDDAALREMIEQNANRPQFDASDLQSQIGGLEKRLGNIPQFDDSALREMIEQNRGAIRDIPMPPSFERIDEREDPIISRMPNENPVPFLPQLSPSPMPMPAPIATPKPMSQSFGMRNIRGMR